MSDNILKLIIGISAVILFIIIMSGCSKFEKKFNIVPGHQLNCSPPDSPSCAGWNTL